MSKSQSDRSQLFIKDQAVKALKRSHQIARQKTKDAKQQILFPDNLGEILKQENSPHKNIIKHLQDNPQRWKILIKKGVIKAARVSEALSSSYWSTSGEALSAKSVSLIFVSRYIDTIISMGLSMKLNQKKVCFLKYLFERYDFDKKVFLKSAVKIVKRIKKHDDDYNDTKEAINRYNLSMLRVIVPPPPAAPMASSDTDKAVTNVVSKESPETESDEATDADEGISDHDQAVDMEILNDESGQGNDFAEAENHGGNNKQSKSQQELEVASLLAAMVAAPNDNAAKETDKEHQSKKRAREWAAETDPVPAADNPAAEDLRPAAKKIKINHEDSDLKTPMEEESLLLESGVDMYNKQTIIGSQEGQDTE